MNNRNIKINIVVSMVMRIIGMVLSLVYTPIVLSFLGDNKYGVWAIILNILSWISYFDIGIGNGLRNHLTSANVTCDKDRAKHLVSTSYILVVIISVVFFVIISVVWVFGKLSDVFHVNISGENVNNIILLSLGFVCINFVISLSKTIIYTLQQPAIISISGTVAQAVQVLAVFICSLYYSENLFLVALIYGSISMTENIGLSIYTFKKDRSFRPNLKFYDKKMLKPLLTLSAGFFIMQICTLVLNTTDNLLISYLYNPSAVTPYSIVYKVFIIAVQIHAIIIIPMWSAYTEAKERRDIGWIKRTVKKINSFTVLLSVGVIILMFIFKPLARWWLSNELDYGTILVPFAALYVILQMIANSYGSLLNGISKIKSSVIIALVGSIINIPLSYVFAKVCGLGVAGIILGSIVVMLPGVIVYPIVGHKWIGEQKKLMMKQQGEQSEYGDTKFDITKWNNNFNKTMDIKTHCVRISNVTDPLLTILIPTFRRPDTLRDAIESAIHQLDYTVPYEILVIDNDEVEGSETRAVIDSYDSPNISYYINDKNLGMYGNWNRGIELAKGKYVVMLHDDDVLSPYFIKNISQYINSCKRPCRLLGVGYEKFSTKLPEFSDPGLKTKKISIRSVFWGQHINIAGMVFMRQTAIEVGGFDEDEYPCADTCFIGRIISNFGNIVNIDGKLAGYRIGENASLKQETLDGIIIGMSKIRELIAKQYDILGVVYYLFKREILYEYIAGANEYWGKNMDSAEYLAKLGMKTSQPSKVKRFLYKIAKRLVNI